jgi:tetratricopeptide (TPR) repeat protein/tRNA A-37 threonylcarbamoyl transferase component Bud32
VDLRDTLQQSLGTTCTIERELDGGNMARVFLASEPALDRRIVIKVLPPELVGELSVERFKREMRVAAHLSHPNIVPILSTGQPDQLLYFVMPFVSGESLRHRMQRERQLPVVEAVRIACEVASALDYAHRENVVHRDIKPENVLLADGHAMVADFGIARAIVSSIEADRLTGTGISVGTPAYMSPEQALGDTSVDGRTDIYALGCMLYEMLAGVPPYAGATFQSILTQHAIAPLPNVTTVRPAVSAALAAAIYRAMAKAPADRFASGAAFASAIEQAALAPLGIGQRKPIRSRALAGIAAAVAVVAAILLFGNKLRPTPSVGVAGGTADTAAASEAYLRAEVKMTSENAVDVNGAIGLLKHAIVVAPRFAPAYAALARADNIKAFYFAADWEKASLNEDAAVMVEKALAIDPRLAEAHFARGLILWTHANRFPHDLAIQSFRRALELNPNMDEAHHQLGLVYFHIGLLEKGKAELQRAVEINPSNTLARFRLGVIDMYRNQFADAYALFNSTSLEKNPAIQSFQIATVLFRLGRTREAVELLDASLRRYPRDEGGTGTSVRAMIFAQQGDAPGAEAAIQRAIELGRGFGHFHHTAYNIASAYALMHRAGPAVEWLQAAADDGFPCYPLFANDANLDNVRQDRRFIAFMTAQKAQWEQYRRKY